MAALHASITSLICAEMLVETHQVGKHHRQMPTFAGGFDRDR
jgi:hypothetical protein